MSQVAKRTWIKIGVRSALFPLILFWPAGTLHWWEGWVFLGLSYLWLFYNVSWLAKNDPDLLEERANISLRQCPKLWDKVILLWLLPLSLVWLPTIAVDAVRFGWSEVPAALRMVAALALLPACYLINRVLKENSFLSPLVKV